jgi:hypothetical protein
LQGTRFKICAGVAGRAAFKEIQGNQSPKKLDQNNAPQLIFLQLPVLSSSADPPAVSTIFYGGIKIPPANGDNVPPLLEFLFSYTMFVTMLFNQTLPRLLVIQFMRDASSE